LPWVRYKKNSKRKAKIVGVYALYQKDSMKELKLVYIGHSSDVYNRLNSHEKDFDFAKIILDESLISARDREVKLIKRLKPKLNKDFTNDINDTKPFSCTLEIDVWRGVKIKNAVQDIPINKIVNDALRVYLERWIEIGNQAR